jgi:hypothetical protein
MAIDTSPIGFLSDTVTSIINTFKWMIGIVIFIFFFVFVAFVVIKLIVRWKRNKLISEEQNKILHAGKLNAQRYKLRYLFTSDDNRKLVNIGKIVSFVKVKERTPEKEEIFDVFVVKRGFDEYRFYKIKPERHSRLFVDIILYDWNFSLDAENKYMVINTEHLSVDKVPKKLGHEAGVDSIGLLSPVIHKAVQVNPLHRIQLRMTKLIKMPDEGMAESTQQVVQYLTGGEQK